MAVIFPSWTRIGAMGVGGWYFLTTSIGCCGIRKAKSEARQGKSCRLRIYFIVTLVTALVMGGLTFVFVNLSGGLGNPISSTQFVDSFVLSQIQSSPSAWVMVQDDLVCCGFNSTIDETATGGYCANSEFRSPESRVGPPPSEPDPDNPFLEERPCRSFVKSVVMMNAFLIIGIMGSLVFLQLISLYYPLAVCCCRKDVYQKADEDDAVGLTNVTVNLNTPKPEATASSTGSNKSKRSDTAFLRLENRVEQLNNQQQEQQQRYQQELEEQRRLYAQQQADQQQEQQRRYQQDLDDQRRRYNQQQEQYHMETNRLRFELDQQRMQLEQANRSNQQQNFYGRGPERYNQGQQRPPPLYNPRDGSNGRFDRR
eukprot:CAMPEP_0175134562 /NCGR_PEP_ID=MMETSP0087-20121206/8246_1 /TAXON_ID=136419 /ORGANISM="Unknown Unknown, Strain D1" /LENGTH=368 /DNA_ID=CAMNT_0016417135 /DNA_START=104 /DNA_END=1210 /DNA_ORIENTATION=+